MDNQCLTWTSLDADYDHLPLVPFDRGINLSLEMVSLHTLYWELFSWVNQEVPEWGTLLFSFLLTF